MRLASSLWETHPVVLWACWRGASVGGLVFCLWNQSASYMASNHCNLHLSAARAVHYFHLLGKWQQLHESVLTSGWAAAICKWGKTSCSGDVFPTFHGITHAAKECTCEDGVAEGWNGHYKKIIIARNGGHWWWHSSWPYGGVGGSQSQSDSQHWEQAYCGYSEDGQSWVPLRTAYVLVSCTFPKCMCTAAQ